MLDLMYRTIHFEMTGVSLHIQDVFGEGGIVLRASELVSRESRDNISAHASTRMCDDVRRSTYMHPYDY